MRLWTVSATVLLGLSACSTQRTSVAAAPAPSGGPPCGSSVACTPDVANPDLATPVCSGPWLATVTNNGKDDAEAYIWRGGKVLLGIVPPGKTREYLTTESGVLAESASGGSTYQRSRRSGQRNKNIVIRVDCADKA